MCIECSQAALKAATKELMKEEKRELEQRAAERAARSNPPPEAAPAPGPAHAPGPAPASAKDLMKLPEVDLTKVDPSLVMPWVRTEVANYLSGSQDEQIQASLRVANHLQEKLKGAVRRRLRRSTQAR